MSMHKRIAVITGPTATGKTAFAVRLAQELSGEIVSADSMQIYKGMDIGSAKPSLEELSLVRHHLIGAIDPRLPFSVAEYQKMAKEAIAQIFDRGKVPVVCGGTGLYVNSLLYDMDFAKPPTKEGRRDELAQEARLYGSARLHSRLAALDEAAAARIHPNNVKKIIRAIEVLEQSETGKGIPKFSESFVKTRDYDFKLIGLLRERQELYHRIDLRVDQMMEDGLLEEVKGLLASGLTEESISMKGIGYKELIPFLKGEQDLEEAVRLIKRNSRRYAKRQITWFKRDPHIRWFDLSRYPTQDEAFFHMLRYINESP